MKRLVPGLLFFFLFTSALAQTKIPLDPSMVLNISTWGDATRLVDEQEAAGDPSGNSGGEPSTDWLPGWTDWYYPVSAIIDLGGTYQLDEIWLYDINSSGNVSFHGGTPFQWDLLAIDDQGSYQTWKNHTVDIETRYVMVTLEGNVAPTEIVFYGSLVESDNSTETSREHTRPLMKDFTGLNGFIDDPLDVLEVGGFLREYHNWSFTEVSQGVFEFIRRDGGWEWNFDNYYRELKDRGVTVAPCIQNNVEWISTGTKKPVSQGEDPQAPSSYSEHASLMYQYAARYGAVEVPSSMLKLNSNQEEKSGLGLLTYYENWNEQDKWWEQREGWFHPFEYAAMTSADVDGHQGSLGDGYGIKTADPDAKMVMGGLAGLDLEYVKAMQFWFKYHRTDNDFPLDVINFHHYSNDVGGQGESTTGVSPEEDKLKERIERLVDYRDKYLHGKEVWITEFGYDVNSESVQRAPAYGEYSAEDVQAMWLIRSYLAIAAAGADKAAMYMSRDTDEEATSSGKYSTSGLTTQKGEWEKRPSFYYVGTFKNVLSEMQFDSEVNSGNDNVLIYKFATPDNKEKAYVLWSPTADGTTIPGYTLNLESDETESYVLAFRDEDLDGDTIAQYSEATSLQLEVSEKPVIVTVNDGLTTGKKATEESLRVKVFPTLASDFITLTVPEDSEYTLTNSRGHMIKSGELKAGNNQVGVQGLSSGVYFIKFNKWNTVKKVVIR